MTPPAPGDPASVPYVCGPGEDEGLDRGRHLGGKGAALCALAEAGFPVPPFFCVSTRALREIQRPLRREISARLRELAGLGAGDPRVRALAREISGEARSRIRDRGLGTSARRAIEAEFDRRFRPDAEVAVRSSVAGEDSDQDSFAGQMDTHLFVGRSAVVDRVLACLTSSFSERALLYRHARTRLDRPVEAGAVVQEMVTAERSGVAFTADPVTGDPSEIVVSAGFGLGEGVVGDRVETDTFRVAKAGRSVRTREIVTKELRVVRDPARDHGTRLEEVPEELREGPVLSDDEVAQVAELAQRLEGWSEAPCDVEWSLEADGTLWLLQSRPVTGLSGDRLTILDNSNIVESYPGISSPLTFSFVRRGYAETFREAMRTFGVSEAVLDREQTLFHNLVAMVDGRIYYSILHWYRLYELMGLEGAIPAWERALGLSRKARPASRDRGPGLWRRAYIRARLATNFFGRRKRIRAYHDALRAEEEDLGSRELDASTPHELLEHLEDLTDRLLAPYGIAVVNDLYAQQLYDLVGRLVERWGLGDPDRLRNDLMVGGAPSDSVRAVSSLTGLADEIRETPRWRSFFEAHPDPGALWEELQGRDDLSGLRRRLERHLSRYGDRTVQELKLETPSLRDDPTFALRHLRSYALAPRTDAPSDPAELRRSAQGQIRERLSGHPLRRAAFSRLVTWTREALRHRENLRLARTRAFGLVKRIYGALASRFSELGILDEPRDVFFLTVEEIEGAVRGHSVHRDLRRLIGLRREEYRRHEEVEPPPRIVVRGPLQAAESPRAPASVPAASDPELRGQGCSRGVARGAAAVVREPRSQGDVRGRILVAPMTDPGWVFLMVAARGLVVEKGSLLSHTAIVGRELGIPTVVGVPGATTRIGDGDVVEIDGAAGTVRILERARDGDPRDGQTRSAP